jgi:hypothetical protein
MSWTAGVIERVDPVGDKGPTEIGAKRVLNGVFHETLLNVNDEARSMDYSIDGGPGPVAAENLDRYRGHVQVFPVTTTDQSFVLWISDYQASDEAAVGELCNPVYHAFLAALAARFAD